MLQPRQPLRADRATLSGLRQQDLPDGEGRAVERVELSTHNGTHLDARYHFHSTQDAALASGLRQSVTLDEVQRDGRLQPGVKLDHHHLPDGHVVTADELQAELARIGHRLPPLETVWVKPGPASAAASVTTAATVADGLRRHPLAAGAGCASDRHR